MTGDDARGLFRDLAEVFAAERERLGDLDAAVGDGDHGAAMARGFALARDATETGDGETGDAETGKAGEDAGQVFQRAGRALLTGVGGASGALFATLLLELGKAAGAGAGTPQFAAGLRSAVATISRLGKAAPGDKTMLDALAPAAAALEQHLERPLAEALTAAAAAARGGAEATRGLAARHGRARYVADAGRGHADPGAESAALIVAALARAAGTTPPGGNA